MTSLNATVHTTALPSRSTGDAPSAASAALRILQITLAAVFVGAGTLTWQGTPDVMAQFGVIEHTTGLGAWIRSATGLLEVIGSVLLCARASAGVGAVVLSAVMTGAVAAHVLVLRTAPTTPAVLLAALAVVAYAHRASLAVAAAFLERNL